MSVPASAREQSTDEIYRLVCEAAVQHRPITALYDGRRKFLCPHVLGYNRSGDWRVFCYQYGGETKSGPLPSGDEGIWRCLSVIKLSSVEWLMVLGGQSHAPQHCVRHVEVDADDYPGGDPQKGQ